MFSRSKRSQIMSRIRGRDNAATELLLRSWLRQQGITGWRRHYPIPGTPDFAFPKQKVALLIDGCFWHGCPKCKRMSKTNKEYWSAKVLANRKRDSRVNRKLRRKNWRVIRIWQCELKKPEFVLARLRSVLGRPLAQATVQDRKTYGVGRRKVG